MFSLIKKIKVGLLGGLTGTLLMSVWMLAANFMGRASKAKPLPPEKVTETLEAKAGIKPFLTGTQHKNLSLLNHFVYGSVIAIPLSFINKRSDMMLLGSQYGLGVWLANYLGILPCLRLYPPANKEPKYMNFIMIISHLIWGNTADFLIHRQLSRTL